MKINVRLKKTTFSRYWRLLEFIGEEERIKMVTDMFELSKMEKKYLEERLGRELAPEEFERIKSKRLGDEIDGVYEQILATLNGNPRIVAFRYQGETKDKKRERIKQIY